MRILVTGAAGYIGGHVLRALAAAGCQGVGLDVRAGAHLRADMLDAAGLKAALAEIKPDGVIHLAAHSSVAESVTNSYKYRENAQMCRHLSGAAFGLPVVLASSAAVYGAGGKLPIAETFRPRPVNPYGLSKLESEAALPRATALRFFNVAGEDGDAGDHIVPRAVQAAVGGGRLRLHGDGSAVRDFVHVQDVARATVSALMALSVGGPAQVLNICSGVGRSVLEVIWACEREVGAPVCCDHEPPRAGDVSRLVGDRDRALQAIGWVPEFGFDDIIVSAVRAAARQAA